jgi:hypothetical protein
VPARALAAAAALAVLVGVSVFKVRLILAGNWNTTVQHT